MILVVSSQGAASVWIWRNALKEFPGVIELMILCPGFADGYGDLFICHRAQNDTQEKKSILLYTSFKNKSAQVFKRT